MRLQSQPAERRHCLECDAQVCRDFRRVYGDRDDRAHRCPECDTWVRLCEGSAAGKDVPTPDPRNHPERNGGEPWHGGIAE